MEQNDRRAVIALITVTLLGAWTTGSAVLFSRAETLVSVRDKDQALVTAFLRAQTHAPPNQSTVHGIQEAVDVLVNKTTGRPNIGLTVTYDDSLVATNVGGEGMVTPDRSSDATVSQAIDLGEGWYLTVERYERHYRFDQWHSFLSVPVRQFFEGRDIYWEVVKRKATTPAVVTLVLGLILILAYITRMRQAQMAIQRLEESIRDREDALLSLEARAHEIEESNLDRQREIDRLTSVRAEAESRIEQLRSELNTVTGERDVEHTEREAKEKELKVAYDWATGLDSQQEEARKSQVILEEKLRLVGDERDRRTRELQETQQELERISRNAASATAAQGRMLERLWDAEWHRDARKEALEWFMRQGQPHARRRLVDLLTRAVDGEPPRPGDEWKPMKPKAEEVFHNRGKDSAKLYWGRNRKGNLVILAVSGGDDDHQKFDRGTVLRARWQTVDG